MKAEKQYKEATSRVIQPLKGGGGYVVNNRLDSIIQTKLSDIISGSRKEKNLVQRMVRVAPSPYDSTSDNIIAAWNELDNDLTVAIAEAIAGVQGGGPYTPHQKQYLMRPTAANWGYCIEEKLNDKAGDNDWGTQEVLGGSRPDYHKEIDSTHVFADLTTDRESGGIGLHIWEKLKKCRNTYAGSVGADVTYTQTGPTTSVVYVPTQKEQAAHLLRLFDRVDYEVTEDMDNVKYRLSRCASGMVGNYSTTIQRALEILSTSSDDDDNTSEEDMSD